MKLKSFRRRNRNELSFIYLCFFQNIQVFFAVYTLFYVLKLHFVEHLRTQATRFSQHRTQSHTHKYPATTFCCISAIAKINFAFPVLSSSSRGRVFAELLASNRESYPNLPISIFPALGKFSCSIFTGFFSTFPKYVQSVLAHAYWFDSWKKIYCFSLLHCRSASNELIGILSIT